MAIFGERGLRMIESEKLLAGAKHERLTLDAGDGHDIHVQFWSPADDAKGIIQIIHGLGEHGNRYARFAAAAVSRGFVVAVHDHRGHGEHRETPGFFAAKNGWQLLVSDSLIVHEFLAKRFAGLPVTLLGHSMGSFVAQDFAMHHGGRLDALLLSASTWAPRVETLSGNLLARRSGWPQGR